MWNERERALVAAGPEVRARVGGGGGGCAAVEANTAARRPKFDPTTLTTHSPALQNQSVTLGSHLHCRPLACVPEAKNAMLGSIAPDDPRFAAMAAEGARTIPGRENGGNCDIKVRWRGAGARAPPPP